MNPDYQATINMLRLLDMLERARGGALRINSLAEEFGVHRRTVIRWVDALQAAAEEHPDLPTVRRERRQGEAWVQLVTTSIPLSHTIFQYAATYVAVRSLAAGGGSLLSDSADYVLEMLQTGLPSNSAPLVSRVTAAFHYVPFGPKAYRDHEAVLDVLVQSVLRRWPVVLEYQRPGKPPYEANLHPYTLVLYRDALYVLGLNVEVDELRTYAVDRVVSAKAVKEESFVPLPGFKPETHYSDRLGIWAECKEEVVAELAFSASAERTARERQWPGFKEWKAGDDGRAVLVLEVAVSPEVVTWILSWGPEVEVLAPEGLRQRVAEKLAAALERYSG
ncbi:MAG: WYL domain-containing transcriptional regulator [Proteobacteria bacterium]|nr:WYL domain-containing transcriptional regulator [Pseudomonadota bacterium]